MELLLNKFEPAPFVQLVSYGFGKLITCREKKTYQYVLSISTEMFLKESILVKKSQIVFLTLIFDNTVQKLFVDLQILPLNSCNSSRPSPSPR